MLIKERPPRREITMPAPTATNSGSETTAILPTPEDVASLRQTISRASTAAKVVEFATEWLSSVLSRVPAGGVGTRQVAGFRAQRPSGTLKSIKLCSGGSNSNLEFTVERAPLLTGDAGMPQVLPHEGKSDPFVVAFEKAFNSQNTIVCAVPVINSSGLWGALCIAFQTTDMPVETPSRLLRVAARIVNDHFAKQGGPPVSTVLESNPRVTITIDDFLSQVDLLLACAPKDGPGLTLMAYAMRPAPGTDTGTLQRLVRQVAQRVIEATRNHDLVAIYDSETVFIALPRADAANCKNVSERIRNRIKANLPAVANGGFAFETLDATATLSRAMLAPFVAKARSAPAN